MSRLLRGRIATSLVFLLFGVTLGTWTARIPAKHGVVFLGVLACCALVGEGAAADWSAVYLRDSLDSSAG